MATDGSGQVQHCRVAPGQLHADIHLARLQHCQAENIQLTAAVTASINAELRVGNLQETVTVTGESPIVDTRSARRQQVIDGDIL